MFLWKKKREPVDRIGLRNLIVDTFNEADDGDKILVTICQEKNEEEYAVQIDNTTKGTTQKVIMTHGDISDFFKRKAKENVGNFDTYAWDMFWAQLLRPPK